MSTISESSLLSLQTKYHDLLQSHSEEGAPEMVLLSHFGAFNDDKILSLVRIVEQLVLESGSKRRVMKRVGSVLIESLQNAMIHGAHDSENRSNSFLLLKKGEENFSLSIGNLILSEDANLIDFKISELNNLDKSELRKLYIETLCNENYSYKGGAGLGFLTIAKKAAEKVKFEVQVLNDEFSFFIVEIKVAR